MDPINIVDDWAFAIGNFLLNFGVLDLHVFEFLQATLPPEEFAAAKKEVFRVRLKRAGKILSQFREKADTFKTLSKRLEPLRVLRNHIAHGHLFVRPDTDTGQLVVTIAKSKDQDDSTNYGSHPLSPRELLMASKELADLCEEFQRLFGLYQS